MPRTLAQNAQYIAETIKPAIKSAIEAQGVTVPSTDSFLDYADRIGEIEGGGSGYQLKDLPTGAISTVNDAAPLPLNALKVSVEAVQDLHGYDKPWVGGAGKNLLQLVLDDIKSANTNATWSGNVYVIDGVTFTVITDNADDVIGIHVNGLATNDIYFHLPSFQTQNNINYSINGAPVGGANNKYWLILYTTPFAADFGSGANFTGDGELRTVDIVITNRYNAQDLTFYPMIRLASETDPTFEPYSNICPIEGWDSGEITVCDDLDNPTQTETTALDFPTTIYGAEWDVVDGPLDLTHDVIDLSTLSWSSTSWGGWRATRPGYIMETADTSLYDAEKYKSDTYENISDPNYDGSGIALGRAGTTVRYIYVRSTDAAEPTGRLKYPLATPTTIDLSPLSIRLLQGTNNLYADCGEVIEGEYFIGSSGAYDLYDYIQTDGTQLIDTGRAITAGDVVNTIFTAISGGSNGAYVWGKYVDPYYTALVIYPNNGFYRHYDHATVNDSPVDQTNFTVGKITEDSYTVATTLGGNYTLFDTASVKLYAFSVNGDDYLPCKRRSDGKFGLYDVKNSTFLTDSASGNAITGGNNLGVRIG